MADFVDIDPSLEQEDVPIDEVERIERQGYYYSYSDANPFNPKHTGHYVVLGANINANEPKNSALRRVDGFYTKSPVYVVRAGQAVKVYPGKSLLIIVRPDPRLDHVTIEPYRGG